MLAVRIIHTPFGQYELTARVTSAGEVLCRARGEYRLAPAAPEALEAGRACPLLDEAETQFQAYFAKKLRVFALPLAAQGTAFEQRVRQAVISIPYGETRSYGAVAQLAGNPGAARAVGGACARNPYSLIVPCHRVIGANGALTGFGGDLAYKLELLRFEAG